MMEKAKVYFTRNITPENVVRMFGLLGKELPGKVAVKVHSGEKGNQNFLRPEFMETHDRCCQGHRGGVQYCLRRRLRQRPPKSTTSSWNTTAGANYFDVDILDAEGPDAEFPIPNGKQIKKNYVGKDMMKYDSMLVLSHFKGHPRGGYGGALKQLSIGCGSSAGKTYIHSAGVTDDQYQLWNHAAPQDAFLEAMADAASSVVKHFNGNMAFVNIMCNMSVDCDCCAIAEDPCMKDIGILASLDPIAPGIRPALTSSRIPIDPGRDHMLERINTRHGTHTIDAAAELGFGTKEYELVNVD